MDSNFLTEEEINAYVQYEAGNREYFKLTEEKYAEIGEKIRSSELHQRRYEQSKQVYDEILGVKEKSRLPFMAIAASVVLLIVCTAVYFFGTLDQEMDNLAQNTGDLPGLTELNERYGLNETLDNRVNHPLRGVSIRDILPVNNQIIRDEVKFSWQTEGEQKLTLKIYDKSEKVIFKESATDGKIQWDIPEGDVYYWSLEDENEIFHWGKFYGLND